jgi:hypothetical protein
VILSDVGASRQQVAKVSGLEVLKIMRKSSFSTHRLLEPGGQKVCIFKEPERG